MEIGTGNAEDWEGAERAWPAGALWQGRGAIRIRSLDALLWVTLEGDPEDYFLGPGHGMRLEAGRRKVVVQAMRPGRVRIAAGRGRVVEPGGEPGNQSGKGIGTGLKALLSRWRVRWRARRAWRAWRAWRAYWALAQAGFAALSSLPLAPVPERSGCASTEGRKPGDREDRRIGTRG